jgi:hypothetical protein
MVELDHRCANKRVPGIDMAPLLACVASAFFVLIPNPTTMRSYPEELALLEEAHAALKTDTAKQIDALKKRVAELEAENTKLRERRASTPPQISSEATQMLFAVANERDGTTSEALATRFGLSPAQGGLHFDQLVRHRFVIQRACSPDGFAVWEAEPAGRSYLAHKGLL